MRVAAADGTGLAVRDSGGTGGALVLLHAWGLNSHMWNAELAPLQASGFRTVTIDQRGHGSSDVPTSGYELDTLSSDIATVLETLDLRDVVLVAHSMGGLEAATVASGALTKRIGALVLSAPATLSHARTGQPRWCPRRTV